MDPVVGPIVGALVALVTSLVASRVASKAKRVDESVAITTLQMDTWKALLAERDKTIDGLRADLARYSAPAAEIAELEATIAALSRQNEAMHAELLDLRPRRRTK